MQAGRKDSRFPKMKAASLHCVAGHLHFQVAAASPREVSAVAFGVRIEGSCIKLRWRICRAVRSAVVARIVAAVHMVVVVETAAAAGIVVVAAAAAVLELVAACAADMGFARLGQNMDFVVPGFEAAAAVAAVGIEFAAEIAPALVA